MAKISLRAYNREIEGMIDGGQVDEGIAHCLHVLKTFPLHIETYRLLGKAFLESRRYGDAADIFQRILMSVPDDFVSHVGMSIIRDDENKLDDAIWHMERAYQMQPSNPAIQGEMRRLYARRDGVEPTKIRLSREALANMYAQGELYNQAITEIRSILAEDPNRPDLQIMLARAYYRAGQKVEATEICVNLLRNHPNCLDALRILADILPGTGRAENVQVYQERVRGLDPYSPFVTGSLFQSDQVADATVGLERLDYQPGSSLQSTQPNWAASLGISIDNADAKGEPTPEWLTPGINVSEGAEPIGSDDSAKIDNPPSGEIPDWMRTAGWAESSGAATEIPPESQLGIPSSGNQISEGEVPDWLKAMAPPGVLSGESPLGASSQETPIGSTRDDVQKVSEFFQNLDTKSARATEKEESTGSRESKIPDWLESLQSSEKSPSDDFSTNNSTGNSELAGILKPNGPEAPNADTEDQLPDWLKASGKQGSIDKDGKPNGLEEKRKLDNGQQDEPIDANKLEIAGESGSTLDGGDALAWLEALAAKQGARSDELITNPESRPEGTPEWVQKLAEEKSTPTNASIDKEPSAEEISLPEFHEQIDQKALEEEEKPLEGSGPSSTLDGGDALAWLEALAAKQGARSDELITNPESRPEGTPEWVEKLANDKELVEEVPDHKEAIATQDIPVETTLDEKSTKKSVGEPLSQGDITITGWLKSLDESDDTEQLPRVSPTSQPSQFSEELPDWLKGLDQPQTSVPESPSAAEELPSWLSEGKNAPANEIEFTSPQIEKRVENVPGETDNLEWMADEPVGEALKPVTPEDWIPEKVEQSLDQQITGQKTSAPPDAAEVPTEQPQSSPLRGITGALAPVPDDKFYGESLLTAQTAFRAGQLNQAMQEYAKLIKKGKLLDEVIHDLREMVYRYPVDVIVWQSLGDAYMRANRLQDALDAYTKAEELLR